MQSVNESLVSGVNNICCILFWLSRLLLLERSKKNVVA